MFGSKTRAINNLYRELANQHKEQMRLREENVHLQQVAENWEATAAQFARNSEYYQSLLDNIAENFGAEAYISQDGSLQDDPLRAKMPKLVSQLACEKAVLDLILHGRSILIISPTQ